MIEARGMGQRCEGRAKKWIPCPSPFAKVPTLTSLTHPSCPIKKPGISRNLGDSRAFAISINNR